MTRDEAIEKLNAIKKYLTAGNPIWDVKEIGEVLDMAVESIQVEPVKTLYQIPEACKNCSNHPSNGGSGICHCTLGGMKITC